MTIRFFRWVEWCGLAATFLLIEIAFFTGGWGAGIGVLLLILSIEFGCYAWRERRLRDRWIARWFDMTYGQTEVKSYWGLAESAPCVICVDPREVRTTDRNHQRVIYNVK